MSYTYLCVLLQSTGHHMRCKRPCAIRNEHQMNPKPYHEVAWASKPLEMGSG